ncbi:MAG: S8 family serine peptidase [Actinomycetes bacterium]
MAAALTTGGLDRRFGRRSAAFLAGAALVAAVVPGALGSGARSAATTASVDPALAHLRGTVSVIVQAGAGSVRAAESAASRLGATVTRDLPIISGFAARLPARAVAELSHVTGVRAITLDGRMHVQASLPSAINGPNDLPSVYRKVSGATKLAAAGDDGHGVTVALIDTGVASLPDVAGRIVPVATDPLGLMHAPCMNFSTETTCADSYGHGTFIAGLIAGNGSSSGGKYVGAAPGAKILSVKLAGADGSADVSQTLAAIQWVVSFRSTYNIKVLNLSLGTDSTQSYRVDPLNYAVEQAWKSGIAVIVAASNRGPGAATVSKPGDDPFVITVGASFDSGTPDLSDDSIPNFSSHGPTAADGLAKPDLVAPGTHLVSLAAPGSTISTLFPPTMPAPYRRGSGTSFANGVVAGVVADMLSGNPALTPDRIKFALMSTAHAYPGADPMAQGAGEIDGHAAMFSAPAGLANQGIDPGDGSGSLELSRGSVHVDLFGVDGSVTTVDGNAAAALSVYTPALLNGWLWGPTTWWLSAWAGQNWSGQNWSGQNWSGQNWSGQNWSGQNWSGQNWSGQNWSGQNWSGQNWSGQNWSGQNWSGQNWSGSAWYGAWDQ